MDRSPSRCDSARSVTCSRSCRPITSGSSSWTPRCSTRRSTSDVSRVTALAKERGRLAKVALPYGRYLELGRQIAEAEAMCAAETDFEMRAYAEAELESLRARQDELGETLRDLLYDQQAGADRAGLIVEIRAGTGGDEAALFARDLLEMYQRYADQMRWKFEPLEIVPDRARRLPRGVLRHHAARGRSATSSSRAAATASSGSPPPRPRGASTPRPPRSPSCPSPRKSRSSSGPRTCRST